MSTTLFLVVYVKPPHARPNIPSAIRMIPSVLFTVTSFGSGNATEQSHHRFRAELRALHCPENPIHLLLQYLFNLPGFLLDFARGPRCECNGTVRPADSSGFSTARSHSTVCRQAAQPSRLQNRVEIRQRSNRLNRRVKLARLVQYQRGVDE